MIVKLQRPLMWTTDEPQALIYDETREYQSLIPFAQVEHMFSPDDLKIYVMAQLAGETLVMGGRLKDQDF